ncbi:MAG: ATP-dependent DNA helicase RecG [Eubacterium sp.]|nr:ATP-dependent DNA helicase RecG [Eubacterium sp.]
MALTDPIQKLRGIGPKRAKAFQEKGLSTLGDLLSFYPKKYLNRKIMGSLESSTETAVTVAAVCLKAGTFRRIRRNMALFVLPVEEIRDDGKRVRGEMLWFNQPYLKGAFVPGETYYFYGKIAVKNGRRQMYNPQFAPEDRLADFFVLTPVYGKIEGMPPETLKKTIARAVSEAGDIEDAMPQRYLKTYDLPDMKEALTLIHCPETEADVDRGKRRIKFEEALGINLGILNNRNVAGLSEVIIDDTGILERFISGLPFELTEGQRSVLADIVADLKDRRVMNRLVQGDVGSGKTIVAVACAFLLAMNGYQSAYMAPTEILAAQHAENFSRFLAPYGIQVALLTGSLKAKEKATTLGAIKSGDAQVVIGTHALIQDGVDYYNLGMVITDEQHRFGVKQRGRLERKGELPHTLVMSATPIPRTLALIFYGDLDVSYIDELPRGRKKIKTYFYGEKYLDKILDFTAKEMAAGRQAFVICPFIEPSEEMSEVRSIQEVYQEVKGALGKQFRVAYLHGKLPSEEKQQIIEAFNAHNLDLLVATSIIEVGIDVPNVSVITILSADRFGLSQLHQLRGRVGRGQHQSYCFLVSNARGETTIERMKVIVNNHNGRKIADEDYRLRGPGDYFGARQHGFPEFKALNPYEDFDLIAETKKLAAELFDSGEAQLVTYRQQLLGEFYKSLSEISMN